MYANKYKTIIPFQQSNVHQSVIKWLSPLLWKIFHISVLMVIEGRTNQDAMTVLSASKTEEILKFYDIFCHYGNSDSRNVWIPCRHFSPENKDTHYNWSSPIKNHCIPIKYTSSICQPYKSKDTYTSTGSRACELFSGIPKEYQHWCLGRSMVPRGKRLVVVASYPDELKKNTLFKHSSTLF